MKPVLKILGNTKIVYSFYKIDNLVNPFKLKVKSSIKTYDKRDFKKY